VVLAMAGLAQARLASPSFAHRFDHRLVAGAAALGHAVGFAVGFVLLGVVYLIAFLPPWLVLGRRRRRLGQPRHQAPGSWLAHADGAATVPRRSFAGEPHRPVRHRRSAWATAAAVVLVLVLVDLTAGVTLTATGALPTARGEVGRQVRGAVGAILATPPLADEPWVDEYADELADFQLRGSDYQPYLVRGFEDFDGEFISVRDGERTSYRPPAAGADPVRVAFFGGSVMFGVGQRDEHTIPSAFARAAEEAGVAVEVHNHGLPAWVAWQEGLYLERLLAGGAEYDLAVFLDGYNEVHIQAANPSADPVHEGADILAGFARQFHEEAEVEPGTFDDLRSLADAYADVSALARLLGHDPSSPTRVAPPATTPDQQVADALGVYRRATALAEGVAAPHDLPVRFFWQPRLGGWPDAVVDGLPPGVTDLSPAVDAALTGHYIDQVHTDEDGARTIAEALWAELGGEVSRLAAARG